MTFLGKPQYEKNWRRRAEDGPSAEEARPNEWLSPPPINRSRLAASYNEAGHAVASFRYDKPVYSIEVDDEGGGFFRHSPPEPMPRAGVDDTKAWNWLVANVEFDIDFVRTQGLILLAAPAAVERAIGEPLGCGDDLDRADCLIASLRWPLWDRCQLYKEIAGEAGKLIYAFWEETEALAKRLYDVGFLHEAEIKQIIRRSFAGRVIILGETDELRQRSAPAP